MCSLLVVLKGKVFNYVLFAFYLFPPYIFVLLKLIFFFSVIWSSQCLRPENIFQFFSFSPPLDLIYFSALKIFSKHVSTMCPTFSPSSSCCNWVLHTSFSVTLYFICATVICILACLFLFLTFLDLFAPRRSFPPRTSANVTFVYFFSYHIMFITILVPTSWT